MKKLVVPLFGDEVAPRFDLATEVYILYLDHDGRLLDERIVVTPQASAEKLCHLIVTEGADDIIVGGIEEEYYQYLTWKRIRVFDSVGGTKDAAVRLYREGKLAPGMFIPSYSLPEI